MATILTTFRWWLVSGKPRCGYSAPDKDGLPATCNGDDPTAHCCSPFGYCGTGPQFCSCPDCVDFRKRPDYCYPVKQWWTWDDGADKVFRSDNFFIVD